MAEDTTVPQEGQTETQVPPPEGGETKKDGQDAHSQSVPDNLKGKSPEELAKMYVELGKKIGEQGQELGTLRQMKDDIAIVVQALEADPDLKEKVKGKITELYGKTNGEKKEEPKRDKTQEVVEIQLIDKWMEGHNLHLLDPKEKEAVMARVGNELSEMFDPGGSKSLDEILDSVDLKKLPGMLERAYIIANHDGELTKAEEKGRLKAQTNQSGAFGSIQSSGLNQSGTLTPEQKEVARKLGISEEDYQKNIKVE